MGKINQNQFQTQQTYSIANAAVAEQADAENYIIRMFIS